MEGIILERLDLMSTKVREKVTVCQGILHKFEEGSPSTQADCAKTNRLRVCFEGFVSEIQMFLQSHSLETNPEEVRQRLREYTQLQLDASEVLADLDIYLLPEEPLPQAKRSEVHTSPNTNLSRLPRLEIPKFDGNILHWHAFWDKFTSSVANKNLSDVDKLSYLVNTLEGEAARAIAGLDTTNANYTIAVDRLRDRFAKPGILKDSHYVALQQIPRASSNVGEIRKVLDDIERHLQVLKSLGEDTNHTGLRATILDKFPADILGDLRQYTKSDDESVDNIRGYLEQVITTREDFSRREAIKTMAQPFTSSTSGFTTESFFSSGNKLRPRNKKNINNQNRSKQHSNFHSNESKRKMGNGSTQPSSSNSTSESPAKKTRKACFFCSKGHFSDSCTQYPTVGERKALLRNKCYQCFSDSHLSPNCPRKMNCRHCGVFGAHNRALCPSKEQQRPQASTVYFSHSHTGTVLQTVQAPIHGPGKTPINGRILFDTGSERSYVTTRLMKQLKLEPLERTSLTIFTFGCKHPKYVDTTLVCFAVQALDKRVDVTAYAVPTTTNDIPAYPDLKRNLQSRYPALTIAKDVEQNLAVDIIIGNDFYHSFISAERKEVTRNLFLIKSCLGWIVSGACQSSNQSTGGDHQLSFLTYVEGGSGLHAATPVPPDPPFQPDSMRCLWEVETIGITDSPKILQDDEIVDYFNKTTIFRDGRYFVKWPWVQFPPDLPVNYGLSYGRLKSLLKRTDLPTLCRYDAVFQDQLSKGVIEIVQESRLPSTHPVHYLPHHCVINEDKLTKLRVVYDASAKVQGQCSLNELLYKGPLMLEDLTSLLLLFRTHSVALTADIEKAFLQIGLQSEDRDVTRFLWLKDPKKPLSEDNVLHLRFCRVPFGIVTSPFLLAATVRFHLYHQHSPLSTHISNCLYVDNLVSGAKSRRDALALYQEARTRFDELSMNIREWSSNDQDLLQSIPAEQRNEQVPTTVLGVKWEQNSDELMLNVKKSLFLETVTTKRDVSHVVASLFDPCGFAIPLTLGAKLFLQNLWIEGVKWDTPLSATKLKEWEECMLSLAGTAQVSLERCYWPTHVDVSDAVFSLHCFADASRDAYAAAVYLRICTGSHCSVSFVLGRQRLTPIRYRDSWTIPKLELMAVLIGVRLLAYVQKALQFQPSLTIVWTDSQVVLGWLKSERLLPPFVTRRVLEIKTSANTQFRYVPSSENAADIATRPLGHETIPPAWFHGPSFLLELPDRWPSQYVCTPTDSVLPFPTPAVTTDTHIALTATDSVQDPPGVSLPTHGTVLPSDTVCALQRVFYPDECAHKLTVLAKNLGLYTDEDGCLRCKGRFQNAELTDGQKHPLLLPKRSHLTSQLIQRIHELNHHVGVTHTLSLLRQMYWVPHGRATVKSVLASCPRCVKYGGGPYRLPPMSDLPATRVSYSAPFTFTGLDYLGPLSVSVGGVTRKCWICLFICMAVRAVHLEIVTDMSAAESTLALRRFFAAQGSPTLIVSDNAAQFKATATMMQAQPIGDKTTKWEFIPELSPWHGGFYEQLVGLVKHCLRRSLDRSLLTDAQLHTLIKEIESILNTRPLCTVGDELEHVLTPSDFLQPCGPAILEPPTSDQSLSAVQTSLIAGWKRNQKMLQEFRRMFSNQYLVGLREHHQFSHKQPRVVSTNTPRVGAIVLVKGDSANRAHWNVAKITALFPSNDGKIRTVRVLFPSGSELTRPINLLYPLEVSPDTLTPQLTPVDGTRSPSVPSNSFKDAVPAAPVHTISPLPQVDGHSARPQRPSACQARRRIREWTSVLFAAAIQ